MADLWTPEQQNDISALYKKLVGTPQESEAYKQLFGGPQLPYDQAKHILDDLIKKHEKGGLEKAMEGISPQTQNVKSASSRWFSLTPRQSAVGLVLLVLALAALSPISAPATALGYATAYTAPIYAP